LKKLRISPDLTLPIEAVTETFAVLAKRGAGKTYTAKVLIEEMLEAQLPVVVVDPIGAWWGLRAGADGKPGGGYEVAVLGGDRGDIPLEPGAGGLVADLVVDERLSAVLDLSAFSKTERRDFVRYFLERLYQRNRDPLHVVLEEADLFAPEGTLKKAGDEFMLGAVYDLVRRGRSRGLGCTMITQRSASISKEVLTQAEILIALRTTGPHDRKAIEEWIKFHGTKDERDIVLGELSGLPTGTAFVWWPVEEILRKVEIRQARTYDSSATPKPGERRRAPKKLADVDLQALRKQMAATIEKAEAEDPTKLRARVRELEKKLATSQQSVAKSEPETVVDYVEVPVLSDKAIEQLEQTIGVMRELATPMRVPAKTLEDGAEAIAEAIMHWRHTPRDKIQAPPAPPRTPRPSRPNGKSPERAQKASPAPGRALDRDGTGELGLAARKMLNVLAQFPEGRTRKQLAVLSGYKAKGSTYRGGIAELRSRGYATPANEEPVRATDEGLAAIDVEPLPLGQDLYEYWRGELPAAARTFLTALYDVWPEGLTREELAEHTGYPVGNSTYRGAIAALRNVDLATPAGVEPIKAADELFQETT
jgi:hypothetical protein